MLYEHFVKKLDTMADKLHHVHVGNSWLAHSFFADAPLHFRILVLEVSVFVSFY